MRLVIGITGATGVIYGVRLLEVLAKNDDVETHLILSENSQDIIKNETGRDASEVGRLADFCYQAGDQSACLASGSFKRDGMIVAPCTVKTMSALADSYSDNLLVRSGDVTLKEGRKLVLLVRETPLHIGHIRSMERLCEMGATIMPPVPAFYHRPKDIMDLVDHTIGKVLDLFGIEHNLFLRWSGTEHKSDNQ